VCPESYPPRPSAETAKRVTASHIPRRPGNELPKAASIEAPAPGRLRHIHRPLARPVIASLVLLKFLSPWNQFLLALVLINDPDKRTMAGALQIGIEDVEVFEAGAADEPDHVRRSERRADELVPDLDPPARLPPARRVDDDQGAGRPIPCHRGPVVVGHAADSLRSTKTTLSAGT
jgi:hypothetical protein